MGFFDSLLSAGAGFATGGLVGAGVGLLSSLGGSSKPKSSASTLTPTQQALNDNAYMRGYLGTVQGRLAGQGGAVGTQNMQNTPQRGGMGDRRANQRGGAQNGPTPGDVQSANAGRLQGVLQQGLQGEGGVPQRAYDLAQNRGANTINMQAEQSRNILQEQLGRRGLLQSGILGQGIAGIEQGRLSGLAGLSSSLQTQQLADQSSSRQWAADVMARLQQGQAQIESSEAQQRRAINASQPSTFDRLAGLAGSYAAYRYAPKNGGLDEETIARLLGGGVGTPTSVVGNVPASDEPQYPFGFPGGQA